MLARKAEIIGGSWPITGSQQSTIGSRPPWLD